MPWNPENIFVAMLALLAFASPTQADLIDHTYWAYIPNPPFFWLFFLNLNLFILIGGELLYNIVLVLPYINMIVLSIGLKLTVILP